MKKKASKTKFYYLEHQLKLILVLFILLLNLNSYSQNCNIQCDELLMNTSLEINPPSGWPIEPGESGYSFNIDYVPSWHASHGSPHHCQLDGNGDWNCSLTNPNGTETNGISVNRTASWSKWSEGMFQNVSLSNDPFLTYYLNLKYQVKYISTDEDPNHFIKVNLASNLENEDNWGESNFPENIPHREIYNNFINSTDIYDECISFNLTQDESFDQIWIFNDFPEDENEIVPLQWTTIESINLMCTTDALTDILTNKNNKTVQFDAVNSSTSSDFVEYHWDFGDGYTSEEISPTHTYEDYGTYTVCLKVKDEYGCCGEYCEEVEIIEPVYSCENLSSCYTIGSVDNTTYLSDLLNGSNPINYIDYGYYFKIKDQCFYTEGKLIIDIPVIFDNTTWFMGSGSSIDVNSRLLDLEHSVFQGCDQMWRGIMVLDDPQYYPRVYLTGSTIKDAYIGLEIKDNALLNVYASHFLNNTYGVYLGSENSSSNSVANYFTGNEFAFTGEMLPQYYGQPEWYARAHVGIKPTNLTMLKIDNGNEFHNLRYGIRCSKSSMEVTGSSFLFDDISNTNNYHNDGIKMENSTGYILIEDNDFINNNYSIRETNGSNNLMYIKNNRFNFNNNIGFHWSIFLEGNNNGVIKIFNDNNFIGEVHGVTYIKIDNCDFNSLNVDNNHFNSESLGSETEIIRIDRSSGSSVSFTGNDFIMDNPYAIAIYNSSKMDFIDNTMTCNDIDIFGRFFLLNNFSNGFFKNNYAHGYADLFDVKGSNDNTFCCNSLNDNENTLGRTFSFNGGQIQFSSLYANKINKLRIEDGSIIGKQPSRGNIWDIGGSRATIIEDNNFTVNQDYILMNQFNVDPNQSGFEPTYVDPPEWKESWFKRKGTSKSCEDYDECNNPSNSGGGNGNNGGGGTTTITDDKVDEVVTDVVLMCKYLDSIANINIVELLEWTNQTYFYDYQISYPEVDWVAEVDSVSLSNNTTADCVEIITEEVIDWYNVDQEIDDIYTLSDSDAETIENSQQIISENIELIDNWYEQYPDSIDEVVLSYHQAIADEMDKINDISTSMHTDAKSRAQVVLDKINELAALYPFLIERKKVLSVSMKIIISGKESITQEELDDLQRIAGLCPLEYGKVVYEAWGLLEILGIKLDEITIENNCSEELQPRNADKDKSMQFAIYPNPTDGMIYLTIGDNIADEMIIFNSMGEKITTKNVNTGKNNFVIDMSGFKNGIYIYKLNKGNKEIFSGKLVLMK